MKPLSIVTVAFAVALILPVSLRITPLALAQNSATSTNTNTSVAPHVIEAQLRMYAQEPSVGDVVQQAIHFAAISPSSVKTRLRRARRSAWLPETRLRFRRGRDRGESLYTSGSTNLSVGDDLVLEATMTFRLDRTVYSHDEIAWHRERRALIEMQNDLIRTVVRLYYERRRLQLERDLLKQQRIPSEVRIVEIQAMLDMLTNHQLTAQWISLPSS